MTFPRDQLNEREKVVLDLHPHWWFFAPQTVALIGAVVLGLVALVFFEAYPVVSIMAAALIVFVLFWFAARYLVWTTTNFVLTTDRLINRSGVLSRSGIEIPLERINTVFFRQSLFERILGAGELVVESAGEMGQQAFGNVRKPLNVQNEIYRQMEGNENRKFDRVGRNLGNGGEPATMSIPDQIERLADLRSKGIISDAEFEAKKTDLLKRM
ncbi:MAG: PH domain-containing protein [Acidimicrobiia bacterium]|nr:PH domain-containing protein [Acidimicrobiia bacterium]